MRQFIARKKIKIPRYKIYCILLILLAVLILGANLISNLLVKDNFFNIFLANSFGNILNNKKHDYFFLNIFGFNKVEDHPVINDYNSLEEVILEDNQIVVYIYNTFQTDKYKSNYFSSYSVSNYVTQASFMLKEYLKNYNIGSVVENNSVVKVLKDNNISYANSYAGSRILLEQALIDYPSLELFIDLQISDYEREATTAEIDGLSFAKILFVIGTDNNNYLENQKFAYKLNEILESINPQLSRGISLRGGQGYQGIYNQDFSNKAILIQVGGINNTIDEVSRTIKVLADVIHIYKEKK